MNQCLQSIFNLHLPFTALFNLIINVKQASVKIRFTKEGPLELALPPHDLAHPPHRLPILLRVPAPTVHGLASPILLRPFPTPARHDPLVFASRCIL
jgi:hypothetical protein